MGAKNLVMLKTHIDSINIRFMNDFVYGNMLWAFTSLPAFVCNYLLYSLGLIFRYIFRFRVGDRKNEHHVPPPDQTERNQFQDSEIDGFAEELANLLFGSSEDVHVAGEERVGKTESSVSMENEYDIHGDTKKREGETDFSVSKDTNSDIHGDGKKREEGTGGCDIMETDPDVHEDGEKIDEHETESSVFKDGDSNVHQDGRKREEEEEEIEGSVVMDTDSATTTSNCQFVSGKDTSGFIEEPTTMSFTFREIFMGSNVSAVSDNAFSNTRVIAEKEFSELNSEQELVVLEEEESVHEQRMLTSHSISGRFCFESDAFGGSDSSDDDYFIFNDNSLPSDSESESSSSSGLIWANSNKFDDLVTYQIMDSNNSCEAFEYASLKVNKEESVEDLEESQFSCDRKVSHGFEGVDMGKAEGKDEKEGSYHGEEACRDSLEKTEETMWEEKLDESNSDEEDEDDFEWEHDDLVEQLKLELRNARQGGLATILEEEDDEEAESPKVFEDLKPLKIEEKLEFKDQIVEIQKVYKRYAEKMRKLDILNYQTMHAIGLLQLKDPLKLNSTSKSAIPGAKPLISQNLWPRKAQKNKSDPLLKFVHELHRDLELVYVGQACLTWEIMCWQHKKAQELKQYDSQWPRRYNLVAGEFQLFQVLMQRFIENEPFQGPRIQSYVKNRCVIRYLLQVPAIKDDSMKDKNVIKGGEEDAIASGRLAEIIKESMLVFREFVRADKDDGNVILKVSQKIGTDIKDPAVSDLLVDIRNQLQKKEKKLKDIVRSGNCIVRKFQKHREDQLDHEQLLAQVGLRLISRVVNMSKLRKDQLLWCNEKLNRIKFVSRNKKIQVEPSFLLFPC